MNPGIAPPAILRIRRSTLAQTSHPRNHPSNSPEYRLIWPAIVNMAMGMAMAMEDGDGAGDGDSDRDS